MNEPVRWMSLQAVQKRGTYSDSWTEYVLGHDYDALKAEFEQYRAWAEPQIVTHGDDKAENERLRAALRQVTCAADLQQARDIGTVALLPMITD